METWKELDGRMKLSDAKVRDLQEITGHLQDGWGSQMSPWFRRLGFREDRVQKFGIQGGQVKFAIKQPASSGVLVWGKLVHESSALQCCQHGTCL